MKSVFHIYKENMKTIFTNYAALIVILALCILPSLYAWFNIKASWDPYGQAATSGIKIGVVNLDAGANVQGNEVNIGDTVIERLKQNKQLGWQFVDEKTAKQAINEGTYYANVTIPANFSKNLTSILSADVKKGTIIYTVNEKINAIAPKMTDKGVTTLQSMISEAIVQTVSETVLKLANQVGVDLEAELPNITKAQSLLAQIQAQFPNAEVFVADTQDGISKLKNLLNDVNKELPNIKTTLENSKNLGGDIKTFLNNTQTIGAEIAPIVKKDLTVIQGVIKEITTVADGVKNAIEGGLENVPEMLSQLQDKVTGLNKMAKGLTTVLKTLNGLSNSDKLTTSINQLTNVTNQLDGMSITLGQVEDKLNRGETIDFSTLDNFIAAGNSIADVIDKLLTTFENTLAPELTAIFDDANTVIDDVTNILNDAEAKLPEVTDLVGVALTAADDGEEGMAFIQEILPKAKALIDDLVEKLALVNEDNGLQKLVQLLELDATSRAEFLAEPVEIEEQRLYPIDNYGSAMAPFYTVLCIWVGILLLMSILSVEAHGEYKTYEVYFGKFLLFGTINIVQALIAALGDLYILKIYCLNPLLFIGGNILIAIAFTAIVYSLVSVFGNIGKVVAIILLVLQVAGSGGTYPVQLTPVFFQKINPFLPFTYGISFSREAIGGVVKDVLWHDTMILFIFTVVSIILAVLLKKIVNRWLEGFFKTFHESKLGEGNG